MKYFVMQLIKTPMLSMFLIMCLLFGLGALGMPAELESYAIVTAIGIDNAQEGEDVKYEVSFLTFIPIAQQGFAERYKVVASSGNSVAEALDYAGLQIGRQMGLSHLKLIALNQELFNDDVSVLLDYLVRNKELSSSVKLVATNKLAKDLLVSAQKLDSESSIKIAEVVTFNEDYVYATDATLETYFKGSFGPTKVGLMPLLSTKQPDCEGLPAMATDNQGSNSSTSTGQNSGGEVEDIENTGETVVFKNNRAKTFLSSEDMKSVNLVRGLYNTGTVVIENFTDDRFKNATITFDIAGQRTKYIISFKNGIPVVSIDIFMTVEFSEAINENGIVNENIEFFVISEKAQKEIIKSIRKSVAQGISIMRENQVDIADFYTSIHNSKFREFKKFLENLEDEEDYLNHIVFKTNVRINVR